MRRTGAPLGKRRPNLHRRFARAGKPLEKQQSWMESRFSSGGLKTPLKKWRSFVVGPPLRARIRRGAFAESSQPDTAP